MLISLFSPEPGNWEIGGPESGNPGFGFGFSISYGKTINQKFLTSELFTKKYPDIRHILTDWHTKRLTSSSNHLCIRILFCCPNMVRSIYLKYIYDDNCVLVYAGTWMQLIFNIHPHSKSGILCLHPFKVFLWKPQKVFVSEPRSYFLGKYSYSVPEFCLSFLFLVLPVLIFGPFPRKFLFPVLPRANPASN